MPREGISIDAGMTFNGIKVRTKASFGRSLRLNQISDVIMGLSEYSAHDQGREGR